MPYKLLKRGSKAKVITKSSGKPHSRKPLPLGRAKAQMRALYAAEGNLNRAAMNARAQMKGKK